MKQYAFPLKSRSLIMHINIIIKQLYKQVSQDLSCNYLTNVHFCTLHMLKKCGAIIKEESVFHSSTQSTRTVFIILWESKIKYIRHFNADLGFEKISMGNKIKEASGYRLYLTHPSPHKYWLMFDPSLANVFIVALKMQF